MNWLNVAMYLARRAHTRRDSGELGEPDIVGARTPATRREGAAVRAVNSVDRDGRLA